MQRIRKLIRFRPDQPRNGSINRRQKILQTRLRQRASKHLRHFSINRFPECMAASHDIFKETGLAFMHSHRSSLPHQRLCQVIPDAKFIDSMSRLMQHGKNRRINPFLIMRRDPYIMIVQIRRKRMGAECQDSPVKIKALIFC